MKLLRVLLALGVALAFQTGLGHLWGGSYRYLDVMLVPVVWYSVAGSQRSGMLVGCAAGLMHDAWLAIDTFGLSGFKKTLLGWVIGGLGSRFDLSRPGARLLTALLASLADSLMDVGLRRLLDQRHVYPGAWEILLKAVLTALLISASFGFVRWVERRRRLRGLSY